MKNILNEWKLNINNTEKLYVEKFIDSSEGVTVFMRSEENESLVLKILFENVASYRNMNESYMLKVWDETPNDKLGKTFYIIDKSYFIEFFNQMTYDIYKDLNLTHYSIYTQEDCIDILAFSKPIVTVVS